MPIAQGLKLVGSMMIAYQLIAKRLQKKNETIIHCRLSMLFSENQKIALPMNVETTWQGARG